MEAASEPNSAASSRSNESAGSGPVVRFAGVTVEEMGCPRAPVSEPVGAPKSFFAASMLLDLAGAGDGSTSPESSAAISTSPSMSDIERSESPNATDIGSLSIDEPPLIADFGAGLARAPPVPAPTAGFLRADAGAAFEGPGPAFVFFLASSPFFFGRGRSSSSSRPKSIDAIGLACARRDGKRRELWSAEKCTGADAYRGRAGGGATLAEERCGGA